MRGVLDDLARQLLDALARADGSEELPDHDPAELASVAAALADKPALLRHVHGLALESQLADRLQARLSLDPVLSPLVQSLVASPDPEPAKNAMAVLVSQARFGQALRRMKLPLGELPAQLFEEAVCVLVEIASGDPAAAATGAKAADDLRAGFVFDGNRLALIDRLIHGLGSKASGCLALADAGVAIFLSALAMGAGLDRETATLATNEAQLARLALALRASGMKAEGVAHQFLALHPDIELPPGFERLGADRAAAILSTSNDIGEG
jgi:hypothetical protein